MNTKKIQSCAVRSAHIHTYSKASYTSSLRPHLKRDLAGGIREGARVEEEQQVEHAVPPTTKEAVVRAGNKAEAADSHARESLDEVLHVPSPLHRSCAI